VTTSRRLPLGVCATDVCNDGVKDPGETDVDCGGSCLVDGLACVEGRSCGVDADCASGHCYSGTCVSCFDGVTDGDETDVDCGGSICQGCEPPLHCNTDHDCFSAVCQSGACYCLSAGTTCSATIPCCDEGDCCGGVCGEGGGGC
jgi:hypothetical protein